MKPVVRPLTFPVRRSLLAGCLSVFLLAAMPAGPAHLVKDINTAPLSEPEGPGSAIVAGKTLYFTASGKLWKSDGTPAGTQLVGGAGTMSDVSFRAVLDDTLYFVGGDGGHGHELWRTDGTLEGTWMLRDIDPGRPDSWIRNLVALQSELYFGANDGIHGFELWKTDGTRDGTVLAADLNPGPAGSALFSLRASGDRLYFSGSSYVPDSPSALYSTDGTASGTRLLRQFVSTITGCVIEGCSGWPPGDFLSFGGLTYFIASDGVSGLELWRTDGTSQGTSLVKDICPDNCSAFVFSDGSAALDTPLLQVVNGRLVFFASDGVHGMELWTSDGTESGTRLVKDIFPGPSNSSYGSGMTVAGQAVFFRADDGEHGSELWRSDGTEAGTMLVADINPGKADSVPYEITPVGNEVFFTAADESGNRRLWRTDSAGSRTPLVSDSVSDPTRLANLDGTLYFTAPGPAGFSLWKTDGTPAGTAVVRVLRPGNSSSNPQLMSELDGLVFSTASAEGLSGLWRSDGTEAGTRPIAPVLLGSGFFYPATVFAPFQGSLFFAGYDGVHGVELWRTDGTPAGTRLVKDIAVAGESAAPWIRDSNPCALTIAGDTLYFGAFDGDHGSGLWKTDGTEAGTVFIKDLGLDCSSSRPAVAPFRGLLYFSGRSASFESGFWRTDGTPQGTELIRPLTVANLISLGDRLIFAGYNAPEGGGLWTSDGTAEGTAILKQFDGIVGPIARSRDGAFFRAAAGIGRTEVWRTDGTPSGMSLLAGFSGSIGSEIVAIGNRAFFVGIDTDHGIELWTSDGTPAGTHMLKDIAPGAADANPGNLTAIDGVVLFSAKDPIHGEELWRSDGTEEGTYLLQDISPGIASSSPANFTKAGSLVYFRADDGETGVELWAMPASALDSAPGRKPRRFQSVPWRH